MNDSYEVVTAALARHARTLDELTAEVRQALATATVTLGGNAFGQIGQSLVTAAEATARTGRASLQSEMDELAAVTAKMRATTAEYDQRESDNATRLASLAGALGQDVPAPRGMTGPASTSDITTTAAAGLPSGTRPDPLLIPAQNPVGTTSGVGNVNGRFGDDRTGPIGAALDVTDLLMSPSLSSRTATLLLVESGAIKPDQESRLGAFAGTHGYPAGTVGNAVHLGIAAIYLALGDAGQENIGRVFNSPEARALYGQPIDSDANLEMARIEYGYWSNVLREDSWSPGAHLATQMSPEVRALAQKLISAPSPGFPSP